jgi:hypothetical protein
MRAIDLAGGVSHLARALQVPADDLDDFKSGRHSTPGSVFLRVVEYLNERETAATLELRFPVSEGSNERKEAGH